MKPHRPARNIPKGNNKCFFFLIWVWMNKYKQVSLFSVQTTLAALKILLLETASYGTRPVTLKVSIIHKVTLNVNQICDDSLNIKAGGG